MNAPLVIKRTLLGLVIAIGVILLVVAGLTLWIFQTSSGTRWALNRASAFTHQALQIAQVSGTFAGPLELHDVRYRDPAGSVDVNATRVLLDLEARELLRATLNVRTLEVSGVDVRLGPPRTDEPQEPSKPFSLDPPVDLVLQDVRIANVTVQRESTTLVAVDRAQLIGAWTHAGGVVVKQLDVRSPQGRIHFAGDVRGSKSYEGAGEGRVDWLMETKTYAASLKTQARNGRVHAQVDVSSPLTARVIIDGEQTDVFPWTLQLDVPSFDPRKALLPDSSLTNLAAVLQGTGDLNHANVRGTVTINDQAIEVDHLAVAHENEALRLEARARPPQGTVDLNGLVKLAQTPVAAQMRVQWRDVVVPETLAGQVLHTQGDVDFDGSAESYTAKGALKLGPPDRIADIRIDVEGSQERVDIQQFAIQQPKGTLSAQGSVDLKPRIAWNANAQASHFNPGAFVVGWKGDLNFKLASQGQIREEGPLADLKIEQLNGELRGRPVEGLADLHLLDNKVLTGSLRLRSGNSRIRVEGKQSETMDANMTLDVPSLNDWVPNAGGELRGTIRAQGRWPDMSVDVQARGNALRFTTNRVQRLELSANVARLKDPRGTVTVKAADLMLGELVFDTLRLQADGEMTDHSVELTASGQPLSTEVRVHGGRTGNDTQPGWSGSVDQLVLDLQNVARLALQEPVKVDYADQAVHVSRACLAGDDIHLCLNADSEKSGALRAAYSLRNVPLALANTLTGASSPFQVSGTIDGDGRIERDADGHLTGQFTVSSSRGSINRRPELADEQVETLLSYADLRLAAQLNGADGGATLSARLNDTGSLHGNVQLSGLGEISTAVRGRVQADLPSISVIEAFAPQLANVHGRLRADLGVNGSIREPQLDGTINAEDLETDVPAIGLKLRNGQFAVQPRSAREFALNGEITSGKGTLRFDGTATTQGAVTMNIDGKQFVAADIPGARVEVDPALKFVRNGQGMSLQGDVAIPAARIDVQKLPRGAGTQRASPDIVVIDEHTQEDAEQQKIPLNATIRVSLGEKVELVGFGLDAKVAGQLTVREAPGSPTTGSGEVRVTGTYKAYGQDLTIRQGQLLFAGTPLENPNLNIIAVRQVDQTVAGLRIQGSARNPQLTVFSEPPMGQSDALAYLVTGKPLSDIGSSGEGDAMQTAARSLGTAAGGLLAKNLGKRLGVDEVGIQDSEAIGGSALTVGQYLSPRLYLSYGVGLFQPGEVVTLRYRLSDQFTIEALNGPRDSRAGIEYRIEK